MSDYEALRSIEARITALEQRMNQCSADVQKCVTAMEENNKNLAEWIEVGKQLKVGLTLLGYIEKASVWITKVSLAGALLYGAWKIVIEDAMKRAVK